ncbi:MAG: cryptochrome/photolyase family protein [Bacteroidota bacterium]
MKLRLILSDQLNSNHAWFKTQDDNILYLMMEIRPDLELDKPHKQKLLGRLASMRYFAADLTNKGHKLKYIHIDDADNEHNIGWNILRIIAQNNISAFEYQEPDTYDTDIELKQFCEGLDIPYKMFSSEHFYTERNELAGFFAGKKHYRIKNFYRYLRKKHNVLLYEDGEPFGGKWNFLIGNTGRFPDAKTIPSPVRFHHNLTDIEKTLDKIGVKCTGNANAQDFGWPLTREESFEQLNYFINKLLPDYGRYQNIMTTHSQTLYHSRLSFALNQKMINPREVIDKVCEAYENKHNTISLPQVEAFVRQILGYREYMRGIYWHHMPEYRIKNHFFAEGKLPDFYWDGNTDMNCMKQVINQSLDEAWVHHTQRLTIPGNLAMLLGVNPYEVHHWFSCMYIDAAEWVEMPNVLGSSQFADGGIVSTKPGAVSASYISKISNYCDTCKFKKGKKLGDDACPFNTLYWHFFYRNRKRLAWIPRTKQVYETWEKISSDKQKAYLKKAKSFITSLKT